jgi:hypothetical protein
LRPPIALIVAVALGAPVSAGAAVSAPDVDLRIGQDRQQGGLVWTAWTARSGTGCVSLSGDGPGRYPRPLQAAPGADRARFVFHERLRPKRVSIVAFRERPRDGSSSEELEAVLRARRDQHGEIVAWRASFQLTPPGRYYIDLFARWPTDECGPPRQLYHRFHIEPGGTL